MKILALDLGTKTGWAIADGPHITSGEKDFKPDRFEGGGMRFLKFKRWLSETQAQLLDYSSKTGKIDMVMFEEVRNHAGVTAAHTYGGFLAHLTAWCEAESIPYQGVPVATIKKHATGKGNAKKDAMITAMIRKGHHTLSADADNEADALAILYYALDTFKQPASAPATKRVRIKIK